MGISTSKVDNFSSFLTNKMILHTLSCGYVRECLTNENVHINPKDIAQIIVTLLYIDWKFDYFFSKDNQSDGLHGIYNNGKTIKCNHSTDNCFCFYLISFGMNPNCGIYTIKFKINDINNIGQPNAIGITCNKYPTEKSSKGFYNYWFYSHDYIAWSGYNAHSETLPNGLLCGMSQKFQKNNIFIKSNVKYQSNNWYYRNRLPSIKSGDTIILQYNSNKNILSFFKLNDDALNSYIYDLPKNTTFYWFVGHYWDTMGITIVE